MVEQREVPKGFHVHVNGGGLVEDTAHVDDTAYIGPNAKVSGNARLSGNARVSGNAEVSGNAQIYGNAEVYGYAEVYGDAKIHGNVKVYGDAEVYGNAKVSGIERSDGYTFIYVTCSDGVMRIIAGCRYFTMEEAYAHWEETRGGTALGDETIIILESIMALSKIRPEGCV